MSKRITADHFNDKDGNPAGGTTLGVGIEINWQNGPLGRGRKRKEPNGAFVEDVIGAAVDRLEYYQASAFSCKENALAIQHLNYALEALERRTKRREDAGVEGTHKGQ